MDALDALLVRLRPLLQFSPDPAQDEQLGLLYMATYAGTHGFDVRVLDEPNVTLDVVVNAVSRSGAKVVGFFCDHENIKAVFRAADQIRQAHPGIKLVAGGPQASAPPWDERILTEAPFDVVGQGEGEETFLELLQCWIADSGQLADIAGILYKEGGAIQRTPPREVNKNLDKYPIPDRDLNLFGR